MRLLLPPAVFALLAIAALSIFFEGNSDLCSSNSGWRCDDGVVSASGWILVASLVGLAATLAMAAVRLVRWWREQRRFARR